MSWKDFKTTYLTPAFRDIRKKRVLARTTKLAYCRSDTHAALYEECKSSGCYDSYIGFHAQNIPEDGIHAPFKEMYLLHHMEDESVYKVVKRILTKHRIACIWEGDKNICIYIRRARSGKEWWSELSCISFASRS